MSGWVDGLSSDWIIGSFMNKSHAPRWVVGLVDGWWSEWIMHENTSRSKMGGWVSGWVVE